MRYCDQCQTEKDVKVVSKPEIFTIKGEKIEVVSDVLVCSECGEELFDEQLDTANLNRAYESYRRLNGLIGPEDIKQIRERWGSQRLVATLLGWSQATLVRYEGGSIPEPAHHEQLMRLMNDPDYIRVLFEQKSHKLKDRERDHIKTLIANNTPESNQFDSAETLRRFFRKSLVSGLTTTELDFEKLAAVVEFFTYEMPGLVKTKLQKLLFYTDFLSVKRRGVEITGLSYVHHYYGPVPKGHDLVFACLVEGGVIETRPYNGSYEGEIVSAKGSPDLNLFSGEEMEVLKTVAGYFRDFTANKISSFSHDEKCYLETEQYKDIPFSYADVLQLK